MEKKPFIKLLKSPHRWYFFDVNTNEIVNIEEDVFIYLDSVIKGLPCDLNNVTELKLNKLNSNGYLSCNRASKLRHEETPWLFYHYQRNIAKVTLQVTQNCNLRCSYCVYSNDSYNQRSHSGKRMSLKTAKQSIDFLLKHSIDVEKVNVSFYGGEPLLEFDLIKKIVEYTSIESAGKITTYNLTTNGTLMTEEMVKFFLKYDVSVLISIDGPKEIHDESRKFAISGEGSFDVIMKNVITLTKKHPEFEKLLSFNMVINPQNDYDYINSIKSNYNEIRNINIKSSMIDDINSIEKTIASEEYMIKQNYNYFLAFLFLFDRIHKRKVLSTAYEYIVDLKNKINEMEYRSEIPDIIAPGGPCIPGQLRLFVNTDGMFFPCERVSETSESMNIGNVMTGINIEKARILLNVGLLTEIDCLNCWAFSMCGVCCKHCDDGEKLNPELKKTHFVFFLICFQIYFHCIS